MVMFEQVDPIASLYGDLASVKTLNDVINVSIAFDKPVKTQLGYGNDKEYNESIGIYSEEKEKKYGKNSGVISFFYKEIHYEVFETTQVKKVLEENGFVYDLNIGSIFSSGVVPTDFQDFWYKKGLESSCINKNDLLRKKKEAIERSISNAVCTLISDDLIITRCFKVPADGYKYIIENSDLKESMQRDPFTEEPIPELLKLEKLSNLVGKMSKRISGGGYSRQRTFVYLDGNVYVTESEKVIRELVKHGFVESDEVQNLGLGWNEKILDSYYADRYERVMISDEEYQSIEQKSHIERKIEYLEKQNESLENANKQLIELLARKYRIYCKYAESRGEEFVSLQDFIVNEFGLSLPEDIIAEIEIINKVY